MSIPTISVSILGLGRLGASFGLALKRHNASKEARQQFVITGYDTHDLRAAKAKDMKAIDTLAKSAYDAARDKDIVIIALPYGEIQGAYRAIGDGLRDGAVVLDTSPFKLPTYEWAQKYIRTDAHMIGITAVINPKYLFEGADTTEFATEDLFDDGSLLVVPNAKADADAIELAVNFAQIIGAKPHFADPPEHDGWMGWMESLPTALSVAAFWTLQNSHGWNDSRRLGNGNFGRLTHHLHDTAPEDLRDLLWENRQNLVRALDSAIEQTKLLRDLLMENDPAALDEALTRAGAEYDKWMLRRGDNDWDEMGKTKAPQRSPGESVANAFFGSFITKRFKRGSSSDD